MSVKLSVHDIIEVSKETLTASRPPIESYDSVSKVWEEAEYRVDLGNSAVEAGYWTGAPGSISFDSWPYSELCVILSGRVAVEDSSGQRRVYGAGQSFLVPQGFSGRWHTLEATEKIFIGVHAE